MTNINNILNSFIKNLGITSDKFYILPGYVLDEKGNKTITSIEVKQIKSNIISNTYTLDEILTLLSVKKEELMELFNLKGTYVYKDYIVILGDIVEIEIRKNNWLIQSIYKSGNKDIVDYFDLFGVNIITGDNIIGSVADIIDIIGTDTLLVALYNMNKHKNKIFEDLPENADLSLIKSQYKKILENYQDILSKFRLIYNYTNINFEEVNMPNEKTIFSNGNNISDSIKAKCDLGIYMMDNIGKSGITLNYNSLIGFNGDLLGVVNNIKNIFKQSILNTANIINIKTIHFVNKYYIVEIYKYKNDVKEFVKLYDNNEGVVGLIEEQLARQFTADSRLRAQWEKLRKSLLNK